jgi:hypothetical protein
MKTLPADYAARRGEAMRRRDGADFFIYDLKNQRLFKVNPTIRRPFASAHENSKLLAIRIAA